MEARECGSSLVTITASPENCTVAKYVIRIIGGEQRGKCLTIYIGCLDVHYFISSCLCVGERLRRGPANATENKEKVNHLYVLTNIQVWVNKIVLYVGDASWHVFSECNVHCI